VPPNRLLASPSAETLASISAPVAAKLEHGLQALLGEGGVAQGVARAVQADDDAVAHQLVVADALEGDDVLDPRPGRRGSGGQADGEQEQGEKADRMTHGDHEAASRSSYAINVPVVSFRNSE